MARTRSELIARQQHLARRAQSLATIAGIGSFAAVAMFAIMLAISQDLVVSAVAAIPIAFVIAAGGWAVQTRVRLRATGRHVAALPDVDERGPGAIDGGALA